MALAFWPSSTRRSLPTNIQRTFQGLNRLDPFTIGDNYATDIKNMTTANYPVLSTRPGFSLLGSALAARILGLGVWKQTELNAVSNGSWYHYTGSSWSAVSGGTGLSTSANWSFTNFQGNFSDVYLLASNGSDPIKQYDGSTVSSLSDAPSGGNYIETFANRVWCAIGNEIHGCALNNATNWTTFNQDDADPFDDKIDTKDGEIINAIQAGNSHLTIFKPNSIHEMFGAVPSDFRIVPVTFNTGVVSNQAITSVEGTFYFIHQTGFFQYSGGTLPDKKWSEPVQDLINRINPAQISKCVVGSNGKYVYAAIPLDSATDPDTIIEYNTEFDVFSIWKDYAPLNIATMVDTLYVGGVEGQIRQVGGSTSDNGTAINAYVTSVPIAAGSLAQKVMLKRAWVTASVPTGSTMSVALSKSSEGNNDFTTVQTISAENVIDASRVIVPTTIVSYANYIRYKIDVMGPADIHEWATEIEARPIV